LNKVTIKVFLKFWKNKCLINKIKLISKPSLIYWKKFFQLKSIFNKNLYTNYVISTDKGFLLKNDILRYKLGGKLLLSIN
jgi:ribosomal protein S8